MLHRMAPSGCGGSFLLCDESFALSTVRVRMTFALYTTKVRMKLRNSR